MDRFRIPPSLDGPIVGILILVLWEAGVRIGGVPAYLLPPPSAIAVRLFTDWDSILYHFVATTIEVVIGFLLAIVVSIPLAALLAQIRIAERMLYPVLVASQTIPKVAIAPLLVVWFGFGLMPKVLIAFLICFFPIVVDSLVGFRSAPKEVSWLARSMGASRWQTFVNFQVPAALPHIFAGVKVASTLAIVGAIVGEFVAADRGLGYQLIVANGSLDITLSFTVLVVLSLMGVALFALVDRVERWALPWHVSQRLKHGGGQ
ncbi:MAG: ABC transporter permease [Chelatococcus sp.]|jgi:NitT/TauT family transport system permease protein|uniref:ABC transporter permease n=1 Tax=unclassified Chelatococcus TaxID=2638111 RepID=UPI001BCFF0C4|nr:MULTISPECIES: ABC transporter permease [unclassified Chelatococcus]CAH1658267.1 Riboflavin transport system permease protein RibX [Hyphomicrobiales bacterium]MBS7742195.1 ABC transporter permease [Chelatococcus sp. HY11]MBX3539153.1 ABC transporter permease [Chelatococcus sp.]MBX3542687.1 ABC transporter permease [Chelatococcus sp.]MCO5075097.1 ABC transporter permease [Chelatococcus sp.]